MLPEEARWLGAQFGCQADEDVFPLLNVGSSTDQFRRVTQPYIDNEIFAALRSRGGPIYHLDAKSADGVDLVGDVLDADFMGHVREVMTPRCILVSNLLEHVLDPAQVAQVLTSLVEPGGLIVASGPYNYPHHPDPIDNGLRPTVEDVHSMFPNTRLVDGRIIVSSNWRPWSHMNGGKWSALLFVARLALPFYRPRAWRLRIDSFRYVFRRVSAYAVVLAKE